MVKCYSKDVSLSNIWVSSHDKLSDFYASSWQRYESPVPMLIVRLILAAVSLGILVFSLTEGASPYWLIYLTNWGLLFITITMFSGLLVSCVSLCKTASDTNELPWYVSMYWLFYNVTISNAFIITALFWILLYDPEVYEESDQRRTFWLDISTHAINSWIALLELLISRTPVRFWHFYQPLSVGLWYAAFSAIYFAAGGTDGNENPFIYEVLDWREGTRAGLVVLASIAGLLVAYMIVWGVAFCRDKISQSVIRTISHDLARVPSPDIPTHTRFV